MGDDLIPKTELFTLGFKMLEWLGLGLVALHSWINRRDKRFDAEMKDFHDKYAEDKKLQEERLERHRSEFVNALTRVEGVLSGRIQESRGEYNEQLAGIKTELRGVSITMAETKAHISHYPSQNDLMSLRDMMSEINARLAASTGVHK